MKRLTLALALLVAALPAGAGERIVRELRGIKGGDDRVALTVTEYPWSALGRLNAGTGAHCSAMLVGPRLVLSAAHCLWNARTQRMLQAGSLTFVAGWDRGTYLKAAKAVAVHPGPGWRADGAPGLARFTEDWLLLELDAPIGDEVGWLALGTLPVTGTPLAVAGYGRDKAQLPMAHIGCRATGGGPGAVFLHDCDAVQGDSGGPVIAWVDGQARVVGVNVGVVLNQGDAGIAVASSAFLALARRLGAPASGSPGSQARPTAAGLESGLRVQ